MSDNTTLSLQVNNLTKVFGNKSVVKDVSFSVSSGEILGFLGPNGAGKSTTMRMIAGFLPIDSGHALINGVDVTENQVAAKQQFGYLPEGVPLYPEMTVLKFLKFIADMRGYKKQEKADKIEQAIQKVNLSSVTNQVIDTLSKGYKRRVGLAQAIIHDPKILILDEPTDGLDPNQKYEVRSLIKNMAKDKIIIISTHILEEIEVMCNRVLIISDGSIMFDGTPLDLIENTDTNIIKITVNNFESNSLNDLSDNKNIESIKVLTENGNNTSASLLINFNQNLNSDNKFKELSQIVLDKKWSVIGMQNKFGCLEEVFRKITTS